MHDYAINSEFNYEHYQSDFDVRQLSALVKREDKE